MKIKGIIALLLLFCSPLFAQMEETIRKDFKTNNAPELLIKNSFGDVKFEVHESSQIEVLIEINVVPQKEKDLEKVKDKIRVEIKESGNRVELMTVNDLDGINTKELEINYDVKMPINTSLEVHNQFGDVHLQRIAGNLYARIQHGDFFIGEASGSRNSVKVQFGELRLERISDADLEVQHGDFQADLVEDSEIELQFSDAEIDNISGKMKIDVQHSDLNIEVLDKSLTKLEIDAQFSDLNLECERWEEFHFELEGGFTDFSLTSEMKELIYFESDGINTVEMSINKSVSQKRLVIDANHSDVDFD